jgi:hypothetical protein
MITWREERIIRLFHIEGSGIFFLNGNSFHRAQCRATLNTEPTTTLTNPVTYYADGPVIGIGIPRGGRGEEDKQKECYDNTCDRERYRLQVFP